MNITHFGKSVAAAQTENRFALTETQQARLLACRAAWDEGEDEEYLQRLRQRAEDADTLRSVQQLFAEANFAQGGDLNYNQCARLLSLVRALAPNPNLDSRLLRRPGEPEVLNRDLRGLLYGESIPAARLSSFLLRRHAGGQTALQLLCAAFPNEWPLVTRSGIRALQISPEQRKAAVHTARRQFNLSLETDAADAIQNRDQRTGNREQGTEESELLPSPNFGRGVGGMGSALAIGEGLDAIQNPKSKIQNSSVIQNLFADVVIYETVHELLQSDKKEPNHRDYDYIGTHRLITQGLLDTPRRNRRFTSYIETANETRIEERVSEKNDFGYQISQSANSEAEASAIQNPKSKIQNVFLPPSMDGLLHRDTLAYIENFVAAQGFTYPALTLRDYYIALQTKPFCLISGITGTGKTRLTSLFAEALTGADSQYLLLPVRPDWSDSAPLLGYVNLLAPGYPAGRYVPTPFTEFLSRAAQPENAFRAYFLCLDELNLARVEHYLAEILSAMETPSRELILPNGQRIRLPANFFLSGTLNLDESTYSLSRKVLDRANLFTFDEIQLAEEGTGNSEQATEEVFFPSPRLGRGAGGEGSALAIGEGQNPKSKIQNQNEALFLQSRVTTAAAARNRLRQGEDGENFLGIILETLTAANAILQPHGLHFAYRVRDEILRYCANSFDADGAGLLIPQDRRANLNTALDLQLLQKILPRFAGSREQIEAPLRELLAWAEAEGFPYAARKITGLLARLQRDGFAAFDAL